MTTGYGWVERAVLGQLAGDREATIDDLGRAAFRVRLGLLTPAQAEATRRACRTLERDGLVVSRRVTRPSKVPVAPDEVPAPDPLTALRGWRPGPMARMKAVRRTGKAVGSRPRWSRGLKLPYGNVGREPTPARLARLGIIASPPPDDDDDAV